MVKIIGSSKIDDYRKITLEDGVMRSINVRPGDSVLFYKKDNDSSLCVFKAEGAHVTDECDSPMRNHLKEAPRRIRFLLFGAAAASLLLLSAIMLNLKSLSGTSLIISIILWVVLAGLIVTSIIKLDRIDEPVQSQSLVTVAGPYGRDRLTGMSKLTDDGYVVSGDLYVNCLFGASPKAVEVCLSGENGTEPILTSCIKSVPGYTVHRMRFKSELVVNGKLRVRLVFAYTGKSITVDSEFDVVEKEKGGVELVEGPVTAFIDFDQTLNQSEFDHALFDPTDDPAAI